MADGNKGKKRVEFTLEAEAGSQVFVAGTFNDWDADGKSLMEKGDGVFKRAMYLPQGRYEYKFVVNDEWSVDPSCTEWTTNEHGTLNSVVTVG